MLTLILYPNTGPYMAPLTMFLNDYKGLELTLILNVNT